MKVKRFVSAIRAINFLIGMTIHFGMEIMLQILTEVVLFYIFVQKNVRKNIRVVLTAMFSKVTYNSPLLATKLCKYLKIKQLQFVLKFTKI